MRKVDENALNVAKAHFDDYINQKNILVEIETILNNQTNKNPSVNLLANITYLAGNLDSIINAKLIDIETHNQRLTSLYDLLVRVQAKSKARTKKRRRLSKDEKIAKSLSDDLQKQYKKFSDTKEYSYKIIEFLGLKSCPYCNISYTYAVMDEQKKEYYVRPHFDHYYEKSLYPHLSLSFYNLVPACPYCNSSLKGASNFKPIHPFFENFDGLANFTITIKKLNTLYTDENSLEIELDSQDPRAVSHITNFKLNERYTHHKDIVQEILIKKKWYTPERVEAMKNFLTAIGTQTTEDYINLIITGNYTNSENINKRPLAKLNKDIWDLAPIKD